MEATEFRRASHAVWESMAAGWDERHAYLEETARPVTERMLERLAPARGQTILDLAAGTGVAGFAAAALVGSDGRAIVSDFSAAMVEAAKRHAGELAIKNVECRVLDAERLDLPNEAVDGVLCRWGYMLMADPRQRSRRRAERCGVADAFPAPFSRDRSRPVGGAAVARAPGARARTAAAARCPRDPRARRP